MSETPTIDPRRRLQQENEALKRKSQVDDIAFDSANRGLVQAEQERDALREALNKIVDGQCEHFRGCYCFVCIAREALTKAAKL